MLKCFGHREVRKNYEEYEEVVDRKCFFNEVASKEFERSLSSKPIPDTKVEYERKANPKDCPTNGLAHANFVGFAMKYG